MLQPLLNDRGVYQQMADDINRLKLPGVHLEVVTEPVKIQYIPGTNLYVVRECK